MRKILYVARIGMGIVLVLVAAYSLSSFDGFISLIIGVTFMLSGVALGVQLEKHRRHLFFLISFLSFLMALSLHFFPLFSGFQYFAGGFLVYFACAMMFSRKKGVIS